MRTLSQAARARADAPAQRLAWLLTLTAAGDWTWRGATLAVTLGSEEYPSRLAGGPAWSESLPVGGRPGGLARACAEVRVLDLPGGVDSLRDRLATTPPVGLAATLRLAWLDDEGEPLASDDAALLLQGRVTAWRVEPLGVALTILDDLQILTAKPAGRLLTRALLGGSSPSLGKPLPWIFGRVEEAQLLPLCSGVSARLAEPLTPESTLVPLVSLEGFPTTGAIQIGSEIIEYEDLDHAALTLGSALASVVRETPAAHPRGTVVRWMPPDGFTWLVADHPCLTVESVRADGVTVIRHNWSPAVTTLGGLPVQLVMSYTWPLDENGREAARLTATVQGLADEGGALIENPAAVLARLLTDPRLAALAHDRLDAASFAAAATALAARDYRFARRLAGDESLGDLLESAAAEAGLWLLPAGPIRLVQAEPTPQPATACDALDGARWLDATAPARISAPEGFIAPDALELIGPPRPGGHGRPAVRYPPESEAAGALPRRFAMRWLDLAASSAAGDLGELLWAHLGDVPFELEQELPPGAALLSPGDVVRLTSAPLDLAGALAWVAEVAAATSSRVRLRLRGPWAGELCWSADPLTFIRRYAFGAHLALVLNGAVIARLSRGGTLRLRGRLRENAPLAAGPFTAPVALSGGKLYLNCLAGGLYLPFLALDAEGNANLAGTVCERSPRAMTPGGIALGSDPGRFWLSPDAVTGALEYDAATQTLHLKGILIEGVRL